MAQQLVAGVCFLLAGLLIPLTVAAQEQSTPALWRAESASNVVYLMGSMHFGRPDFYPLPAIIDRAFTAARILAVEVDISSVEAKDVTQSVMKYGRLPLGHSLKAVLSPAVYRELEFTCKSRNLPISAFERFQPWFVALQLIEMSLKTSQLQPRLGVDLHFIQRAEGKQLDELESLDGQMRILAELPIKAQEAFLAQTLLDLKNSDVQLQRMASAWRRGDLELLYEELVLPLRNAPEGVALYQAMISDRNKGMADRVELYLAAAEPAFVVVGAAHLPGEDGIVALLRQRGYTVRRITVAPSS